MGSLQSEREDGMKIQMCCKFTVFFIFHSPVIHKLSLDHACIVIGVVSTAVKEGLKDALNSNLNNSFILLMVF